MNEDMTLIHMSEEKVYCRHRGELSHRHLEGSRLNSTRGGSSEREREERRGLKRGALDQVAKRVH